MKKYLVVLMLALAAYSVRAQKPGEKLVPLAPLDENRAKAIAAMLPDEPKGFGDPIEKRAQWDKLMRSGQFGEMIKEADSLSRLPFPRLTEEIYFSYYKGLDSETSKRFIMNRRRWLSKLVWAECLANKGKYLPAIKSALQEILNTTSWAFPAEDRDKTNYNGTLFTIALSSSAYGYELAQTLYLLESRLDSRLRKQLQESLWLKVFQPVLDAVNTGDAKKQYTSLTNTGNYNAVTLACVTGAALAVIRDKQQRAAFAAIAERYSDNYLAGILDDGYCSEGMGYYFYGFGHYLWLREQLWQATEGKLDLLQREKVQKAASYVPGIEMINGRYPAIGDCEQFPRPQPLVMYYLKRNLGLAVAGYDAISVKDIDQFSLLNLMYFFPNSTDDKITGGKMSAYQVRTYFDQAGVLIVRPAQPSTLALAAALKGGHNGEHHNHNDLGSFSVVVGDELLMGDPGLATYTPKYFSAERYDLFKTAASYGHPVPLPGGRQQQAGAASKAVVKEISFSESQDVFSMDLKSAYRIAAPEKLERCFTYLRSGNGQLQVLDEFAFKDPQRFETALITRYPWRKISEKEIEITGRTHSLRIKAECAHTVEWSGEIINEGPAPYHRIAVRLSEPLTAGALSLSFTPLSSSQ